jgi:2-polyprenyl-3-methyl-5-hydroxy-6-metoxy-1,4-benzoquinol methylase
MIFRERIPSDFDDPKQLPDDEKQASSWQDANRSWWEEHSMRYDFHQDIESEEFSPEFYKEIDQRFFGLVWEFMPWARIPFDPLIDFESLKDKRVLEIGVGNGSHAALLAQHAGEYVGIDLTEYAVKSASTRLKLLGLPGEIRQMDAENLEFEDESFDYIWSWGVIHHSSNTENILKGMNRILKPGGTATTMVYHKSKWRYYMFAGLNNGILLGRYFRGKNTNQILQEVTDGAIARY